MIAPTDADAPPHKLQAGILAHTALVMHQTVNLGRGPEWIQTLTKEQLHAASDRLYRVSRRHEDKAVLPLYAPGTAALLLVGIFFGWLHFWHVPFDTAGCVIVVALCALIGLPVWMGVHDVHRRHRKVVMAAEQRWAEVIVELALREPGREPSKVEHTRH